VAVPERVAMQMTRQKTRSAFERYNIVSECDLVEAAKKLNALQTIPHAESPATAGLKPLPTYEEVPTDRDRERGPAAPKPRSGEGEHNLGTVSPDRGSRLRVSLKISCEFWRRRPDLNRGSRFCRFR
jgi:hypothetical protein